MASRARMKSLSPAFFILWLLLELMGRFSSMAVATLPLKRTAISILHRFTSAALPVFIRSFPSWLHQKPVFSGHGPSGRVIRGNWIFQSEDDPLFPGGCQCGQMVISRMPFASPMHRQRCGTG